MRLHVTCRNSAFCLCDAPRRSPFPICTVLVADLEAYILCCFSILFCIVTVSSCNTKSHLTDYEGLWKVRLHSSSDCCHKTSPTHDKHSERPTPPEQQMRPRQYVLKANIAVFPVLGLDFSRGHWCASHLCNKLDNYCSIHVHPLSR